MTRDGAWPPELIALAGLLRQLDDWPAIARNSLIAPELAGVAPGAGVAAELMHLRVRAAILGAVAGLDAAPDERGPGGRAGRQRAIVTRCDLRGEKHAAVARSLGISLRHFYRERRTALERLLGAVRQRLSAAPNSMSEGMLSRFELDLDHVAMLRLSGRFGIAFRELATIARGTTNASDRVRAWCYAVELAADIDDSGRARQCLREAVRSAHDVRGDNEVQTAYVDVEMASAFASWQARDFAAATTSIEKAVGGLERLSPARDRTRARAAVGILFRGSELACLRGRPREALKRLATARSILETATHKPGDLTAQLFFELSVVHGSIVGGAARAIEYATEALEAFRSARSNLGVAASAGALCSQYTSTGQYTQALALGSLGFELARTRGSLADAADHALILSPAATLSGDPARGLALAKFAQEHATGGLYETRALIAMAEATLLLGDPAAALTLAKHASEDVADASWDRYQGVALRIQAEACDALDDRRAAAQYIERSVAHLERHGHPISLKRAYESSGRLTGRKDHARSALELGRAFDLAYSLPDARL